MAVGRRRRRQESEGFAAAPAKTAANPDPIVVLIMSLFAPAPMTTMEFCTQLGQCRRMPFVPASAQIRFEVVLRR
jgi:hypothetical protein